MPFSTSKENLLGTEIANLDSQGAFDFPITSGVPAAGTAVGQRAYDPVANILYAWDGSVWQEQGAPTGREKLTAARTYYVDPAGSDANDGLTVGTPFLTPIKACDVIMNELDLAGNQVTVQFADGTYDDINPASSFVGMARLYGLTSNDLSFAGAITFRGNPGTPSNVVFRLNDGNYAFDFAGLNSSIVVDGFTITKLPAATSLSCGISAYDPSGFINVQNLRFDDTPGIICFFATDGGRINIAGDVELVAGSRLNIIQATNGATIQLFTGADIEFLAGAHTIVDDVVCSIRGSYVQLGGTFTETGTVTGRPFQVAGAATMFNLTPGEIPGDGTPIVGDDTFLAAGPSNSDPTGLQYNDKIREKLTADRTYYVDPAGSDANDGLTVGTPFLTPQKAMDVIADEIDAQGHVLTISIADGTYTGTGDHILKLRPIVGHASETDALIVVGNAGSPQNVVFEVDAGFAGILARRLSYAFSIEGFKFEIQTVATTVDGVIVRECPSIATLLSNNFDFSGGTGACRCYHLRESNARLSGTHEIEGTYIHTFLWTQATHLQRSGTTTVEIPDALIIQHAFVRADYGSVLSLDNITFTITGSATGRRFILDKASHITHTTGSTVDLTYFPGTVDGQFNTAVDQYQDCTAYSGVNNETLSANKTLVNREAFRVNILDPGGANRDVDLPPGGNLLVKEHIIVNPAGSGFDLVLKESAVTLSTITPGTQAAVVYDGTDWITI